MLFQLPTSALLLALVVLADASSHGQAAHHAGMRRRQLNPRGPQPVTVPDVHVPRASLNRRSCKKKTSNSTLSAVSSTSSTHAAASTSTTKTTTEATSTKTTSTKKSTTAASKATAASGGSSSSGSSGGKSGSIATVAVASADFTPVKPAAWPTATQSGPQPTSTVASASDPYLEELSKAIDNSGNSFFTTVHTGDMTYYGQGLGACGDVYDDQSFTAAVSMEMFDNWPGASAEQNRNPICGPFVPGRKALNSAGVMAQAITSSVPGYAEIGGDGLINCVGTGTGSSDVQCHVPMTATVSHGGKSIQVQIVDRCVGCKEGDIDLTPAAFAALADMSLGRTDVTWFFNKW
ncbi:DPBB-1 domain-containing protein [Mycena sanguinolenta]|uniref:DPBB-1 domain-containing protein n=1 Tax=Mycena sanguinolenta TaxID=230812 RepID=A0A8H7DFI2_9AGAR|nr:DPBB-1 domain-containing protein [Mycena sanguinolenta]